MQSEFNLDDIREHLPACRIHWLEETESTNTVAKNLVGQESQTPFAILTKCQTAGRGQHGKSWWSTEESLTFSLVMEKPKSIQNGLLPLAVANVVAGSIDQLDKRLSSTIKWPNDVFLGDRKVGGILIENVSRSGNESLVIGIGINLNCTMKDAPADIQKKATSVFDEYGQFIDVNPYVVCLIQNLLVRINDTSREYILPQFKKRLLFRAGTRLTIQEPDGKPYQANFAGISACGALIVNQNGDERRIASASIIDWNV